MKQTTLTQKQCLKSKTQVVDLFCGIGGFSEGARRAGHNVVLAVDSNPFLLGAHSRNHKSARHICISLPFEDLPFPERGEWHLHGSPPCQKLSVMQPHQYDEDRKHATDLVAWFFSLVKSKRPTSWSFEQVNHATVRKQLTDLKIKHPQLYDWDVFDSADFQVPQNRRRIIAGSPFLIQNLRLSKSKKRKSVVDVIPFPPRKFIKNSLYSRPDPKTGEYKNVQLKDQLRSVNQPCYTILATGHKKWCDEDGIVLRHLTGDEGALIQTFPKSYRLPFNPQLRLIGVGNAFPPLLAEALMRTQRDEDSQATF